MQNAFVVNCRPHNWESCDRETIFGLKEGINLPAKAARFLGVSPEYASRAFKRTLVEFLADKLLNKLHTPES